MIIRSIALNNFRQFYGIQSIDLTATEKDRNVVVIYGANGRGKTSLYRALMFCLYGERVLAQDPEDSKEIHLVNEIALERSLEDNTEVESYVEVSFSHKNIEYKLKRCLLSIKTKDGVFEQLGSVILTYRDIGGNSKVISDQSAIDSTINAILDKRLREYFLFDGEKIERLTRATRTQKEEVQIGIKNLLNIDRLFTSSDALSILLKSLERQLKRRSTGEYKQLLIELEEKEKEFDSMNKSKKEMEKEFESADILLKDIETQLKRYEGISQLVKERTTIQDNRDRTLKERSDLCDLMIRTNDELGLLLFEPELANVEKMLKGKMDKHELPSQIREGVVERILKEKKCICGTIIADNSDAHKAILEWKNKVIDAHVEQGLLETYRDIGATRERIKNRIEEMQNNLQEFSVKTEEIEKYEQRLAYISDEIGSNTINEDIPRLEEDRKTTTMKKAQLEVRLENITKKIAESDESIKGSRLKVKDKERQEGFKNNLIKRRNLIQDSLDALLEIQGDFISEIKEKIGEHSTINFHKLIDKEGARIFKDIKVADDYSLQLYDKRGKPFLANISAGQRQVTSISFITALAQIAGGEEVLEVPLFMDTPFGRLSGEHRDNIIENIPHLTKQWILLATDTEFTSHEIRKLRSTDKWNKVYVLVENKPYFTEIKEVPTDSFTPVRSG